MVCTHIVHDDDIPFVQGGNEGIAEIVQKFFAGRSAAVNRISSLTVEPY